MAKTRGDLLEHYLPNEHYVFYLFVRYYLECLPNGVGPRMAYSKFIDVQAWLSPESSVVGYTLDERIPRLLTTLDQETKEGFYWQFPKVAKALFPPSYARKAIQAFVELNRRLEELNRLYQADHA